MKSNKTGPEGRVVSSLDRARTANELMFDELIKSIEALKGELSPSETLKARHDVLRNHQKTLMLVLDYEAALGKREKDGIGGGEFDLGAARSEIERRLARIAEREED